MQRQPRVFGYIPSCPKNLTAYVYASVCKERQAHIPTEIIGSESLNNGSRKGVQPI